MDDDLSSNENDIHILACVAYTQVQHELFHAISLF